MKMSENGQNTLRANWCRERPSTSHEVALTDNCIGDAGLSSRLSTGTYGTIECGRGLREVGCETSIVLNAFWLSKTPSGTFFREVHPGSEVASKKGQRKEKENETC